MNAPTPARNAKGELRLRAEGHLLVDSTNTRHLSECFLVSQPDNTEAYCTCTDDSPEWTL